MAIIHISEADAVQDFRALLDRVSAGQEAHIARGDGTIALLHTVPAKPRLLSEIIARMEQRGPAWSAIQASQKTWRTASGIVSLRNAPIHGPDA